MSRIYAMSRARHIAKGWSTETDPHERTPQALFDRLHAEFAFTLDACADAKNAKLPRFWTLEDNALWQSWSRERIWCNPPYGKGLGDWVCKAYEAATFHDAELVVMLVPSSTDLGWWHDYAVNADEIRFIRGRVRFGRADASSTHSSINPSAVLIFRGGRPA